MTATRRLLDGPVGGQVVADDRPVIWVAVLDDGLHVLADQQDAAYSDLMIRAYGKWEQYKQVTHGAHPAYRWVENGEGR